MKKRGDKEPKTGKASVRQWWPEASLFAADFAVILARLGGFLVDESPPGWDLPGHYFAFLKMARDYLPHGHVTGYLTDWLGGIALFQYYAPLLFIIMAGLWLLIAKAISAALFFRLVVFLTVCLLPVAIWYFARTFLGRRAALWALALSPAFVFYPKFYAALGIGAGSVLWVGLFPGALGVVLVFVALALAERLRQKQKSRALFVLLAVTVFGLAAGHTVSLIIGTLIFGAYALAHWREGGFVLRAAAAYGVGLALSAWWLVPFAAGNFVTATEVRGLAELKTHSLLLFFPARIPYLGVAAILLMAAALAGLWTLAVRKRADLLAALALLGALFFGRLVVSWLFPTFTMHYERLFPFIYFLLIAAAADACRFVDEKWADAVFRRRAYLAVGVVFVAAMYVVMFDYKTEFSWSDPDARQPTPWTWSEFPYDAEGRQIVDLMKRQPDVRTVFAQMPTADALAYLGSYLYFDDALPLENGQRALGGLYVESSPLTPFVMPTVEAATQGASRGHGDIRIRWLAPFIHQPEEVHLDRLRFFGVSHVIAYTPAFIDELRRASGVSEVGGTDHFRVFRLDRAAPLARTVPYLPAVYLDLDGRLPFRDLAMVLFAGERSFDFPVIDGARDLSALQKLRPEEYSYVIVSAGEARAGDLRTLSTLGHPLVVLGRTRPADAAPEDIYLPAPARIPLTNTDWLDAWPTGWPELQDAVASLKDQYFRPENGPVELAWQGERGLSFSSGGPVLLDLGYASYWRTTGDSNSAVWPVSPAFMLVTGDGERHLAYGPDRLADFSSSLSGGTALLLLLWLLWPRLKRRLRAA